MKIIFCGDRHWSDRNAILRVMTTLKHNLDSFTVIEGEAPGADSLAKSCAEELGLVVDKVYANWDLFGKFAGPKRNKEMLIDYEANAVVAFHNDLNKSKGTANMLSLALSAGRPVWVSTEGVKRLADFILKLKGIKRNEIASQATGT